MAGISEILSLPRDSSGDPQLASVPFCRSPDPSCPLWFKLFPGFTTEDTENHRGNQRELFRLSLSISSASSVPLC